MAALSRRDLNNGARSPAPGLDFDTSRRSRQELSPARNCFYQRVLRRTCWEIGFSNQVPRSTQDMEMQHSHVRTILLNTPPPSPMPHLRQAGRAKVILSRPARSIPYRQVVSGRPNAQSCGQRPGRLRGHRPRLSSGGALSRLMANEKASDRRPVRKVQPAPAPDGVLP